VCVETWVDVWRVELEQLDDNPIDAIQYEFKIVDLIYFGPLNLTLFNMVLNLIDNKVVLADYSLDLKTSSGYIGGKFSYDIMEQILSVPRIMETACETEILLKRIDDYSRAIKFNIYDQQDIVDSIFTSHNIFRNSVLFTKLWVVRQKTLQNVGQKS
jgi:hypothetical protein